MVLTETTVLILLIALGVLYLGADIVLDLAWSRFWRKRRARGTTDEARTFPWTDRTGT
jgi:hypothetical protein